jgi:hypothetical protein
MKESTRKRKTEEERTGVLTSSRMASFPILTSSLLVSTSKEGTKCFSMQASRMLIRNLWDTMRREGKEGKEGKGKERKERRGKEGKERKGRKGEGKEGKERKRRKELWRLIRV